MVISLAEARYIKGKTQAEMSVMLSIAISTYSMYENGQRKVPEEVATKICEVLERSSEELFLAATFTLSKTCNSKLKKY